ncbi:MAG: Ig-like domain-containing protein [Candidatus Dormibacteria bacterium]
MARFLLALAGVALLVACAPARPAIEDVSPHKDEGSVAADAPVRVTFDRPMDQQSVQSRFEVKPSLGCAPNSCPVTWSGQTMTFTHPGHAFVAGARYTVSLLPGFKDATGRASDLEHSWSFTAEDAVSLRGSAPAENSTDTPCDADLALHFSRAMAVPRGGEITLDPAVPLRAVPAPDDPATISLAPLGPLEPRTHYALHVAAGLEDTTHAHLAGAVVIRFTTAACDFTRSLSVAVLDQLGRPNRIAVLRPGAAGSQAPASLRVVYASDDPIADQQWSWDGSHLYLVTAGVEPHLVRVRAADGAARPLDVTGQLMAASPVADELAYIDGAGKLHLWTPPPIGADVSGEPGPLHGNDRVLEQAGVVRGLAWSGDGRHLALALDQPPGPPALAVLDRETLSVTRVPDVHLGAGTGPQPPMAWSFDGFSLAFLRAETGGNEAAWVYRPLETGDGRLQRVGPSVSGGLEFSADGSLVYADSAAGVGRAPARVSAGTGFSPLGSSVPGDTQPTTAPFDRRIAALRSVDGVRQLWLFSADGASARQLTTGDWDQAAGLSPFGVSEPRWVPASSSAP